MHDLFLAKEIFDSIWQEKKKRKLKKPFKRITIELGKILQHGEEVNPKNLRFLLKKLFEKTKFKKTEIIIKRIKKRGYEIKIN